MSYVDIKSAAYFRYLTDLTQDGPLDTATEFRVVDFGTQSKTKIVGDPAPVFPITIRFNRRGETSSGPCGAEVTADTPTIFCELPCTSVTATNATSVYVSPTGTVALLMGGEAVPTFGIP